MIKIEAPPAQLLVLKATSKADYVMWYNSIFLAATNSHAKKKMDEFKKVTTKLERLNSQEDRKEIIGFFSNVKVMRSVNENRELLFENLTSQNPEIGYLCEIYQLVRNYDEYCGSGNFEKALHEIKKIVKGNLTVIKIRCGKCKECNKVKSNIELAKLMIISCNNIEFIPPLSVILNELIPKHLQEFE